MLRTELNAALSACSGALSTSDLIPVLSCFCFTGEEVFAFDDILAIATPCAFDFEGAVRGAPLLATCAASRAKDVEVVEGTGEEAVFKMGRTKLKLAKLDVDQFVFEWPDDPTSKLKLDEDFFDALRVVALAMGQDPTHPWRLGITLYAMKGTLRLFATNNLCAATASVTIPKKHSFAVSLPPRFIARLLSTKGRSASHLLLDEDFVIFEGGGVRVFSKTVGEEDVVRYHELFEGVDSESGAFKVPKGFSASLTKLDAILQTGSTREASFTAKDGKLIMVAEAAAGQTRDVIRCAAPATASVRCDPALISLALPFADRITLVEDSAVVLSAGNFTFLVSVSS